MRTYRFKDLRPAGWPFTRKHTTTLEKRGEFPMHFIIGDKSVLWVADEVDAVIERRVRTRRLVPIAGPHPEAAPVPVAAAPSSAN